MKVTKPNLIIITGPDRTGKSQMSNNINELLLDYRKLTSHSTKPPNTNMDVNCWSIIHYCTLILTFGELVEKDFSVICDRFYEGELVYGIKYRNQKPDAVYSLEKYLPKQTKLILMDDSIENIISRQDGLSLESSTEEFIDIQNRFYDFFDKTKIANKMKLNLNDYDADAMVEFLNA